MTQRQKIHGELEVVVGTHNLYTEYGLILGKCTFPAPDLKKVTVTGPGIQGGLDMSRSLTGNPVYEWREVHMEFTAHYSSRAECRRKYISLRNMIHGQRLQVWCPRWETSANVGYIEGNIAVEDEEVVGWNGLKLNINMTECDPFIRTGTQTQTIYPEGSTLTWGEWGPYETNVPEGFEDSGVIQFRYYPGSAASNYSTRCGIFAARTKNLLDIDSVYFFTFTKRAEQDDTKWQTQKYSQVENQSVWYTGSGVNKAWDHEFILTTEANTGNTAFNTAFPFTCNAPDATDFWVTCWATGTITEYTSSKKIEMYIGSGNMPEGNPKAGGGWRKASESSLKDTMFIPDGNGPFSAVLKIHVLSNYSDGINFIRVDTTGITSEDIGFRFMVSYDEPDDWVEADVSMSEVPLPLRMRHTVTNTDTTTLAPTSITVSRMTKDGPNIAFPVNISSPIEETVWAPATWDVYGATAVWVAMCKHTNMYPWGENYEMRTGTYSMQRVDVEIGAMPTIPVVSCGSDTIIIANGTKLIIPAGTREPLPILLNSVDHLDVLILGDQPMTITYENGYL